MSLRLDEDQTPPFTRTLGLILLLLLAFVGLSAVSDPLPQPVTVASETPPSP